VSGASGLPRGWLRDTAALYADVFRRGAVLALRNWPVGLAVVAYGVILLIARRLSAPLGLAGGFLLYLVVVACASSWLSLVAEVIRSGRVRPADVLSGFGAYLGDLLTVGFLLWLLSLAAELVLGPFPFLRIVFGLATAVFFNAVPELIYLGRHAPAALLVESYRFIGENWIEWFPANLVLGACLLATTLVPAGPFGLVFGLGSGITLYFAMIVRGLLFQELATSSRRARAFRRAAS
jgi:hypothetical protein